MSRLDSTSRREQIIRAAIEHFSEKGFRGSKTKEIAKKAGISEALLFKHFPDKKNLYQAILEYKMEEKITPLLESLKETKTKKLLLELALKLVDAHEQDPSFWRLLHFSALEAHELSDLFFQKRNLPLSHFLKNHFQKEMAKGNIRKMDAEKTTFAFMAMISGYVTTRIVFRMPQIIRQSPKKFVSHYVNIFWEGIK